MAFKVTNLRNNESCDACQKPADSPVVGLWQSTRHDKNVIFINVSCLVKALKKVEVPDVQH
jgi:hypothetical protein